MEVKDRPLCRRRSGGIKLEAARPGGRREGREQPRQSRAGSALPDGPGAVSETGRYTQGTGVVTPLEPLASSNPVDSGWRRAPARHMGGKLRAGCLGSGPGGHGELATAVAVAK